MSAPHLELGWSRSWCAEDGDRRAHERRNGPAGPGDRGDRRQIDRRHVRRDFALTPRWTTDRQPAGRS